MAPKSKSAPKVILDVSEEAFGPGKIVVLKSPHLRVKLSTLGATIMSVKVFHPKKKVWTEVNVQYTNYEEALEDSSTYFGTTVGRFAGRVGNARFTLDNVEYHTPKNAGEHTIHGGGNTFDKKHWGYEIIHRSDEVGVRFSYRSPHMENGFPAELHCTVHYVIHLLKPNALHMKFDAFIPQTSPAPATIVNMFNHAYWNLNGLPERSNTEPWKQAETVHNHILRLPECRTVIETDSAAVPSGKIIPAKGVLDFATEARSIGSGINHDVLNRRPCGYDHPFPIDNWKSAGPIRPNAVVYSPSSEIRMEVRSTFPCIWVYTANNLKQGASGEPGERYGRYAAVCLEPQHFPDAANHGNFPPTVVRRGQPYHEEIINVFSIQPKDKPSKL